MKSFFGLLSAILLMTINLKAQQNPPIHYPATPFESSFKLPIGDSRAKPVMSPPEIICFNHTMDIKCTDDMVGIAAEVTGEVTGFEWIVPDSALISYADENSISLQLEGSGIFLVTLIVSNEAGSDTAATIVQIFARPQPTIINTGSELLAGGGSFANYHWLSNKLQVAYGPENTYVPPASGWYQVAVYQSPCYGFSDSVYWEALTIAAVPEMANQPFAIHGQKLQNKLGNTRPVTLYILDATGAVKHRYTGILPESYRLPDMASGAYFVLLNHSENKSSVLRWQVL